jgi:hypothetical protein
MPVWLGMLIVGVVGFIVGWVLCFAYNVREWDAKDMARIMVELNRSQDPNRAKGEA